VTPFVSRTEAEEREGRACEDKAWEDRALFGGILRIP
jgi:hypothetical protein